MLRAVMGRGRDMELVVAGENPFKHLAFTFRLV